MQKDRKGEHMYYPVSSLLIECIILSVVDEKDSYGYEISQTVKMVADIKESTLYPILSKLMKSGCLTAYSEEHQGRKRKYYSMTPKGREELKRLKEEWTAWRDALNAIIEGGVRA